MRAIANFSRITLVVGAVFVFSSVAASQENQGLNRHFNISAGAGVTVPTSHSSANLNTGWNLDFRSGVNVNPHFLADVDFAFVRWNLSNAALARAGQSGGYADVWSLTAAPTVRLAPSSRVDLYLVGGPGLYHRGLSFTQPATFSTLACDPFFGFCYSVAVPGNQVVASFSTYKFGYNVGAGLDFKLGSSGLKAFTEARYHSMFTSRGPNLTYVPITFGVRW
jgi:opacity protein-like surface antigen